MNREFRTLSCRRIFGEPLSPLFVHAREVILLTEDPGRADSFIKRTASGLQNRFDVLQTLSGLLLDGCSDHITCLGIKRALARYEDQPASLHCLAIACQRLGRVISMHDLFCHCKYLRIIFSRGTAWVMPFRGKGERDNATFLEP